MFYFRVFNKLDYFRILFISWTKFIKVCDINGEKLKVEITNSRDLTRVKAYTTKEPDTLDWLSNYISEGDNFFDNWKTHAKVDSDNNVNVLNAS